MKVQKSNGSFQDFDIKKIKMVLGRVSDECEQSMNSGDINSVINSVVETMKKDHKDVILNRDLRTIVYDTLKAYGFENIADAYMRGR